MPHNNPDNALRNIATAQCTPQPWKNGGGITRELLVYPDANDWVLRISVADITQDGAFSSFVGITRSFAVIEGAGVELQFRGQSTTITQTSVPLVFDGATAPHCRLINGATRDLNLMCRAGYSAELICAYSGQSQTARGFFNKTDQTLMWFDSACSIAAPSGAAGEMVGWWVV